MIYIGIFGIEIYYLFIGSVAHSNRRLETQHFEALKVQISSTTKMEQKETGTRIPNEKIANSDSENKEKTTGKFRLRKNIFLNLFSH